MSDHLFAANVDGVLQLLVQQQTALMAAHAESLRLQRALIEHLLRGQPNQDPPDAAEYPPPPPDPPVAAAFLPDDGRSEFLAAEDSASLAEVGEVRGEGAPATDTSAITHPAASNRSLSTASSLTGPQGARAARYYQTRPGAAPAPVMPNLDLLRRLQELRASTLVVQFGPHKGSTLGQVALQDPAYLRTLVRRAQRPEVRAAAGHVEALDVVAAHQRPARRTTRHRTAR